MLEAGSGGVSFASQESAAQTLDGITKGASDIEFDKDGLHQMIQIVEQARQATRSASFSHRVGEMMDSTALDPVAQNGQDAADDFDSRYSKWAEHASKSADKTIELLHKIVKYYSERDDDEARKFNGALD